MADVSVYKRCIETYHYSTVGTLRAGEVRLATDPVVTANPTKWVTVTDADMTTGKKGLHDNG